MSWLASHWVVVLVFAAFGFLMLSALLSFWVIPADEDELPDGDGRRLDDGNKTDVQL